MSSAVDKMSRFAAFYCEDCDVQLHDDENFKNHLRGKPHLKQMQRIAEDRARRGLPNYHSSNAKTGMSYYELPSQFSERIGQYYKENIPTSTQSVVRDIHRTSRSDSDDDDRYGRRRSYSHSRRSRSPRQSRSPQRLRSPRRSRSPHKSRY